MIRRHSLRFVRLHCTALGFAIALVFAVALGAAPVEADVIAFWDFNDGFNAPGGTAQIVHAATIGNGTLYQQRADIDDNGKAGVAYADPLVGIATVEGQSMAWDDVAKNGNDDAEFFTEFSTLGYTIIQVRFDVRGNGDGVDEIVRYDLDFDINPLVDITFSGDTIKDFSVADPTVILNNQPIAANGVAFITESVDLSAVTAINNQPTVVLRFNDFRENGSMRIDNLLISGSTAIPEPISPAFLGMIAGLTFLHRRRR